ncbi:hypothetical protein DICPUDRAFT_93234 [Dictyostelium purpureum]|uniref:OsmC family peroxiredoxin n=1 Tax=Dictyostelium purpureum TaxID=5786 RepID=F1A4A8_DICPU|nr:uncharacterized protein DICPUDRAFT_93234 [Dictyostelium purpureum]EGC28974.1 hypothetical protein DICPUDRAFT_93234 [Dictyostelium purpureum]|eukprot:XP_003294503.1 hypothetical protein DICPUDRAFT_93234 [Dictyostelium purpureum]
MTTSCSSSAFKKGLEFGVPSLARSNKSTEYKDEEDKTNPEELVAAAHSSCFTMTLAGVLSAHNISAKEIDTKGTLTLSKNPTGFSVSSIHLNCSGKIPNLDEKKFKEYAEIAKKNCPMSKLFKDNCEITLSTNLIK